MTKQISNLVHWFFDGMLWHSWHGGGQGELLRQILTSRAKNGLRQQNRFNHRGGSE